MGEYLSLGRIMVSRKVWVEGLLSIAVSLVTLNESLRLIFFKDPQKLYDVLGPGSYLLLLSIGLLVTGIIHISHHLKKEQSLGITKTKTSKELRNRLIGSIVVFGLYLILIDTIGYLIGSFVFFILEFRIMGIKSWSVNFVLSVIIAATYYFVFVMYCDMVFPRGLLL